MPARPRRQAVARTKAATAAAAEARQRLFLQMLARAGLPPATPEFRFHPTRRWRFDFAWPDQRLALEVEGGVWVQGRHTRAVGFLRDMEKYNMAACLGWRILRTVPTRLVTPQTVHWLRTALAKTEE